MLARRTTATLALGLAAALLLLPACGDKDDSQPEGKKDGKSAAVKKKTYKIGFAMTLNHPYWNNFHSGAKDEAEKLGVELSITDAQENATKQIQQIKELIASGVDALCVVPVKPDELVPGILEANRRGIPVIIVNRTIGEGCDIVCYVGTSTYDGAKTSAKILADAIGGEGGVVEFHQTLGSGPEILRSKALRDVLKDYPKVEILRRIDHKMSRPAVASELKVLLSDPELAPKIKGIYCHGDEYAVAAGQVCQDRNRKDIAIVGMGGSKEAIEAIKAGTVTGTSYQQPEEEGRRGVRLAVRHLTKEELILCPAITKDNADKFEGQF